jgi:hypothetical protein
VFGQALIRPIHHRNRAIPFSRAGCFIHRVSIARKKSEMTALVMMRHRLKFALGVVH